MVSVVKKSLTTAAEKVLCMYLWLSELLPVQCRAFKHLYSNNYNCVGRHSGWPARETYGRPTTYVWASHEASSTTSVLRASRGSWVELS